MTDITITIIIITIIIITLVIFLTTTIALDPHSHAGPQRSHRVPQPERHGDHLAVCGHADDQRHARHSPGHSVLGAGGQPGAGVWQEREPPADARRDGVTAGGGGEPHTGAGRRWAADPGASDDLRPMCRW